MSSRQLLLLVLWVLPLLYALTQPFSAIDLAGWVAHGRYFLDHHEILRHDIFSVLPTRALIYPSWGISIVYALVYRATDFLTVCLLHVAALGALLAILYRHSIVKLQGPPDRLAILAVCAFWLGSVQAFGNRPSEIALIPLALGYVWISEVKELSNITPKLISKLCVLNMIWVNIHGSFILLFLMLAWKCVFLAISEQRQKPALKWGMLALLAVGTSSFINPFTYRVFPYIFETSRISRERLLEEWLPTTPGGLFPVGLIFYALFAVMLVIVIRRFRQASSSADFFAWFSTPFFLLLLSGFSGLRNAMLPFVVLLPFMAEKGYLRERVGVFKEWNQPKRSLLFVALPFLMLLVLAMPQLRTRIASSLHLELPEVYRADVVPRIAQDIRESGKNCPVFNSWSVGSYLMLQVPNPIFIDSRNIIYDAPEYDSYQRTLQGLPGWTSFLERYQTCFAVLNPSSEPRLVQAMQAMEAKKGWELRDRENGYLLFVKKDQ